MGVFVNTEIKKIRQFLAQPRKIAIITHVNPDGDALASSLALYHVLKKMNHEANVVVPNEYPEFLNWLPGNDSVIRHSRKTKKAVDIIYHAEMLFCLDFNEARRAGEIEKHIRKFPHTIVMIDHHPNPENFANIVISDTTVSSTAELMYDFFEKSGLTDLIGIETAQCLMCGIITDTNVFYHNASNPATFRVMAKLLEKGADKDEIIRKVFHQFSEYRMRLLGYCLNSKMKVLHDFHTAYIALSAQELNEYHYTDGDLEGVVNYPLSIGGIYFSAIFVEKSDHIKISFRSAGKFSVNDFARNHFQGGGHINASGGRYNLPLSDAVNFFETLLPGYKTQLDESF